MLLRESILEADEEGAGEGRRWESRGRLQRGGEEGREREDGGKERCSRGELRWLRSERDRKTEREG